MPELLQYQPLTSIVQKALNCPKGSMVWNLSRLVSLTSQNFIKIMLGIFMVSCSSKSHQTVPYHVAQSAPVQLSFIIESISGSSMVVIDYRTWPDGTPYTITLPWICKTLPVTYAHFIEDGVQSSTGEWVITACEDE